ncbi:S8 family serine peptidase [Qipengyuania gaetbuli]|uniref:S8 family serine peptidase n=1 Tax=Qipengyuania gaetbuli TaxID=266952 RepID=UPI001C9A0442|nr:S8 family serine peptidase [Qipengyuania gaetbuli]MBY6015944.1 S8 family serine peptidase [Qipengyuania gaetbuli]
MRVFSLLCAALALVTAPLAAQVALPRVQLPQVGPVVGETLDTLDEARAGVQRTVERLARDRLRAIDRLVRRNADAIEYDAAGAPARRGELLVMDVSANALGPALEAGFTVLSREEVEGLDLSLMRLGVPEGMDLAEAQAALDLLLPQAQVSADNLHFQSGTANGAVLAISAQGSAGSAAPVGMIDGAPGPAVKVTETRGFAAGAPFPSHHGSSVASLLAHAGAGTIRVADVYGTDKAGGNALAMAKGLGWLVSRGSKVVTISLVGPRNAVLERAIGAAQRKGVVVVAAVGNDGPAAPPAYPASYDGVIAVTAVDGKRRALIEAGRALHLDYSAPGADIYGRNAKGKRIGLRGTSFATPLVAARLARAMAQGRTWRAALDAEAVDLGRKGHDDTYGRGLVCGGCTGR